MGENDTVEIGGKRGNKKQESAEDNEDFFMPHRFFYYTPVIFDFNDKAAAFKV